MNRAATLLLVVLLSGCTPQSLFYYPNRKLYADPAVFGIRYDNPRYPSLNGKMLRAAILFTDQPPKGTVVHFHGNYGNLSNHFPLSVFLVKNGFDVMIFDYQGYGGSEGKPTQKNTIDDGIATVRYAQAHLRDPKTGVVVFGQSVGGAVAIVVAAKEPGVQATVIEAAFSSYSGMGKAALQRSAWTWLFSFLSPVLLGKKYDPLRYVADISPKPVFFIHGDKDTIVPVRMSKELYAKAREPKRIWIIAGADHLENRKADKDVYDKNIVGFFLQALATGNTRN